MTDFTLSSGNICRPFKSPFSTFPMRQMKLSTGMSSNIMYIGACVGLDVNSTSFQDAIVPSSLTSNTVVSTAIIGIASMRPDDPSNKGLNITSTTPGVPGLVPVWDANPMVEFRAHTKNGLLNSTIVGQPHELLWDSTLNILLVNVGASCIGGAGSHVIVTSLIDAAGDSGGAVAFRFCPRSVTSSLSTAKFLALYS